MKRFWKSIWEWFGVEENRKRATAIASVTGLVLALIGGGWAVLGVMGLTGDDDTSPLAITAPDDDAIIIIRRSVFEAELNKRAAEVEAALATATEAERTRLEAEKAEIARRLADIEGALAEREAKIRELEALLLEAGSEVSVERLQEARAALSKGDFSKADDLFSEIEASAQAAVQSAARAAYGRGKIAEEQIRWADAAEHYARAAGAPQRPRQPAV